jgi:hypothetical protein
MTPDEVLNLPEIEYTASANGDESESDDGDEEGEREGEEDTGKRGGRPTSTGASTDIDCAASDARLEGAEAAITTNTSDASETPSESHQAKNTTCTSCSICIDEYEPGEKIRLLPICGHAFHTGKRVPILRQSDCAMPKVHLHSNFLLSILLIHSYSSYPHVQTAYCRG